MELQGIINPLTYPQLIGLISVILIPLFMLTMNGFNFKFGKNIINFKGIFGGKKGLEINDVLLILEKTQAFKDSEYKIKNHDKLRDQMHYAEEKIHTIKVILREAYFDLMATKLDKAEIIFHRDYLNYEILLDLIYEEILYKVRAAIKENGLEGIYKKGKGAYDDHIEFKFKGIGETVTNHLNKRYDAKSMFSRKEVHDINEEKEKECKRIIEDIFYTALHISEEKSKEIKKLEEEYKTFLCSLGIQEVHKEKSNP